MLASIHDLKIEFGTKKVLNGISLDLEEGENLVILGKSGCGKSVLIKSLAGLLKPTSGSLELFGKDIGNLSREELNVLRKKMGFLFQGAALYDSMSVRENLAFPLRDLKDFSEHEKEKAIQEALKNVGLEKAIDLMPSELSGGMRKRVALARAIILKPSIILYDEPTTGLDPITSKEISELILNIQKQNNTGSIIITHDIACVKITANRIIILKDGLANAEGDYETLSNSKDEWVRSFFHQ